MALRSQIEFTEWTPDGHLRHSRFVGLRDDKAGEGGRAGGLEHRTFPPFLTVGILFHKLIARTL